MAKSTSKTYKTAAKDQKPATVRETSQAYGVRQTGLVAIKGSVATAQKKLTPATAIEKMHMVRGGVSKTFLEKVKARTQLDYEKLATVLAVTKATLINKKNSEKFNIPLSERIVGLADLYDFGSEVFDDEEKFKTWMTTPNKALGGELPYELIDNIYGREEVRNVLGRIQYGGYS